MLGDLLLGLPLPGQRDENELLDFNAVVSILEESVTNSEEEGSSSRLVAVAGIPVNIRCRVYPIASRDKIATFSTSREYTDKILLDGFYPRCNSSQTALVTRHSGEQAYYEILDTEKDGDDARTTLLAKSKFDAR